MYLQVLPDDSRDDAHGHAPLHIQAGDGKRHIILLAGHPVVVAGVRYRIDTVGERVPPKSCVNPKSGVE